MLGFGPLSSLPPGDSGVQVVTDVGNIPSAEIFGVGTISNSRGGSHLIRIGTRVVAAPKQYFYARSIPSAEAFGKFTFVLEEYVPPQSSVWAEYASVEHYTEASIDLEVEMIAQVSLEEAVTLSVEPSAELEMQNAE